MVNVVMCCVAILALIAWTAWDAYVDEKDKEKKEEYHYRRMSDLRDQLKKMTKERDAAVAKLERISFVMDDDES